MAMMLQSRFAGLKIDDDDSDYDEGIIKEKPHTKESTDQLKKPKQPGKSVQCNKDTKKKVKKQVPPQQWEQWKQKDEELINDNFECEMEQAIMLSKLAFEKQKQVSKQLKKQAEAEKKVAAADKTQNSKKNKKKVMSLDQFNDLVSGDQKGPVEYEGVEYSPGKVERDTRFFERVQSDARSELRKDEFIDRVKQRQFAPEEVITRVQFAAALESKNKQIEELREDVRGLKEELLAVKKRNRQLCNILGQGEMRDKAGVLLEVERLRDVQQELTLELQQLHAQLEQERSRHHPAQHAHAHVNTHHHREKKHVVKKKAGKSESPPETTRANDKQGSN